MKAEITNVGGVTFDLNQKVYLHHPNSKFWELTLSERKVTYRVGKLGKQDQETRIQQISKDYPTPTEAKEMAKSKILDKLSKGYFSKSAINNKVSQTSSKKQKERIDKSEPTIKINLIKGSEKHEYSGEYFEKDSENIKLEVNQNKVKITKISEPQKGTKTEGFEIRHFDSNQKAVKFCLDEQSWLISQGFKPNHKKFIYTFINDNDKKTTKLIPKTSRKKQMTEEAEKKSSKNFLSITDMTDEAISRKSRDVSSCKSDRSYNDKNQPDQTEFKSSKLGPPSTSCINVLLAETWSDQNDPSGWIMSEKLDGVRCFWTGTVMYSRNGNRFFPPKWFTKNWPKSQLDGQLFIGRGQFSKTISAIKKGTPIDSQWENVRYLVFDAPALKKPFNKRIEMIKEVIESLDNDYIKCHSHRQCRGYTDLFQELEKVNKIEGEGLMLRNPDSFYENRRSKSLLKVKTFHDDEAVILGYKPGTGRCQGMVGALKCRNTHGVQFEVGSGLDDNMRRKPPKIGSKITYKYQQFNKDSGKPRFPTFLRVYEEKI